MNTNHRRTTLAALAGILAAITLLPAPAFAKVPEGGDTRPCVTAREFRHIGALHQTRWKVAQIVDTPGVVASNHTFDHLNDDAGLQSWENYGAPIKYREIRRYPVCAEFVVTDADRYVFVEYRVRYGTTRVEQSWWL